MPTRRFHDTSPGWPKFLGRAKKARLTAAAALPRRPTPAGRAGMPASPGRARGGALSGRLVELAVTKILVWAWPRGSLGAQGLQAGAAAMLLPCMELMRMPCVYVSSCAMLVVAIHAPTPQ